MAGLGNPEERHARTLHNAGFWFVDELARRAGVEFRYEKRFDAEICRIHLSDNDVWLIKPQSYMNLSGGPVRGVLEYYRLAVSDLLVAHDEIDLPPGTVRLKKGGGHGGHNGLRDIIKHTGSDFMRLRIGVGHPGHKDLVTDYVLKPASAEVEQAMLHNIDDAADVVPTLVEDGIEAAMTRLHTKTDS
ncbi:MAG: aminoacyl-tRNA hydrolase [Proteobacteria bacterium]|nr:aminoacyl-tRNA hydrolase [Pseudomonadota bacterium]